ncbi:hypothetical protein Salat_2305800 [Sesamum alatum]|uniref:Secreted protein n=1 Tax=Sesamum alatum TaxID=300844 RepID=A0AAE1XVT5_9LAMI|nr:hypothetical protein Salat_2305800 [Sesamum alatum]
MAATATAGALFKVAVLLFSAAGMAAPTWCVARSDSSDQALQTALDYACGGWRGLPANSVLWALLSTEHVVSPRLLRLQQLLSTQGQWPWLMFFRRHCRHCQN